MPDNKDIRKIQPCDTTWVARLVSDFCDECDHVLMAHTSDRRCSVCTALQGMTIEDVLVGVVPEDILAAAVELLAADEAFPADGLPDNNFDHPAWRRCDDAWNRFKDLTELDFCAEVEDVARFVVRLLS